MADAIRRLKVDDGFVVMIFGGQPFFRGEIRIQTRNKRVT
jgi:hypothetical protein